MASSSHRVRRVRGIGRASAVAALVLLGVGAATSTAGAADSGPTDFQSMDGGVGSTVLGRAPAVHATAMIGATVYVGGEFDTAGGHPIGPVAAWNGTTWSAVGVDAQRPVGVVYSMITVGTTLFVGGDFGVYRYTPGNSAWTDLGWPNTARALVWYDDGTHPAHLVAGGDNGAGGLCRLGGYDGSAWTDVTDIVNGSEPCDVLSLAVMGHLLYVGGTFSAKGATPASNLLAHDGSADSWSAVAGASGNGVSGGTVPAAVRALAVDAATSTLYLGGNFTRAAGTTVAGIASYHAGVFSDVSGAAAELGSASETDVILVMHDPDTSIVAGGRFVFGAHRSTMIATATGLDAWIPLGTATDGHVDTILDVSDSTAIVGGRFTTAYRVMDDVAVPGTAGVAQLAPTPALVWRSPLRITGSLKVGGVLSAHADVTGDPAPTMVFQWFRCDFEPPLTAHPTATTKLIDVARNRAERVALIPPFCDGIPGAVKATYTVTTHDVGKVLGVVATATNYPSDLGDFAFTEGVVPAVPTTTTVAPTTSEPALPATGGTPDGPWAALAVVAIGASLLGVSRRRWLR